MMTYAAANYTDVGIRKKTNQDSFAQRIIDTPWGEAVFTVVCDGMGGLSKGELASKVLVLRLCDWFDRRFTDEILEGSFSIDSVYEDWSSIIRNTNRDLGAYGEKNGLMLGTTVSALLMFRDIFYIVHVGDSRVYELSDRVRILTKDQTFVAREIAAGRMTPEAAKTDPRRSVLLQCVGASPAVEPDFVTGHVRQNAVYFVCSDGFRHQITEKEILENLGPGAVQDEKGMRYGCVYLTELVKNRRETDNITVAAVRTR